MLAILIEFNVKTDCLAAFEAKLREDAAQTLRDDGCFRMEVLRVRGEPSRIVLSELWRDDASIEAHRNKPGHTHAWQEPLLIAKRVTACVVAA